MIPLKAAAFDLDDTLLRNDLSISFRTLETFRRMHDSGFIFVAASGRTMMSMKPFTDQLKCVSLCIACNGALIWDPNTNQVLHREVFPTELCKEIARFGNEYHCYAQTYSDDCFFFNEYSKYSERYAAASMLPGKYVGDLELFIREPRSKILMIAEEQKIAMMLEEARKRFAGRASVTCSKPYYLEFNPLLATKGIALSKVSGLLGLSVKEFAVFGDSMNDLSMLEIAGRSVAVANARQDVLSFCNETCLSNEEDGVARYLAQYVLKEDALS